jgi:hypothetical protein
MEIKADTSKRLISVTINTKDLFEAFLYSNTTLFQKLKEEHVATLKLLFHVHSYLRRIRTEYMKFTDIMRSLGVPHEESVKEFINLTLSIPDIIVIDNFA